MSKNEFQIPQDPTDLKVYQWTQLICALRDVDRDKPISAAAACVALVLSANASFESLEVVSSIRQLKSITGRADKAVKSALEELIKFGLLVDEGLDPKRKGRWFTLTARAEHWQLAKEQREGRNSRWAQARAGHRERSDNTAPEVKSPRRVEARTDARAEARTTNMSALSRQKSALSRVNVRAISGQCPRLLEDETKETNKTNFNRGADPLESRVNQLAAQVLSQEPEKAVSDEGVS